MADQTASGNGFWKAVVACGAFLTAATALGGMFYEVSDLREDKATLTEQVRTMSSQVATLEAQMAAQVEWRRAVQPVINSNASRTNALNGQLVELRAWRNNTEGSRFTNQDWAREEAILNQKQVGERAFLRAVCNDLTRLYRELDRIPPNDCGRP